MSEVTTQESMSKPSSELDKLTTLFNEEIYVRTDAASIPSSKFKIYDDILEYYQSSSNLPLAKAKIEEHLTEHPESISAKYMLMMITFLENSIDESSYMKILLELFKNNSKWTIIEYITDGILKYGDNRLALKFKAEALEKLKKNKELKVVLEKLARTDRKNPEIAKKYALSIMEEDKPKAIQFLKQAAEAFARNKDYVQFEEIWPILIQNDYEETIFFEKIERILLGNRERARLAGYLFPLVEPFKQMEDWDKVIFYLKKILDHEPTSAKARTDLIRVYKQKYASHSLLEDFMKMSELGNTKKPVKVCITNFERNIVFDTGNYVLHRNWGVGKITSISKSGDSIHVDFKDKKDHKLSIQMAITSLKPLKKDHIWVRYYENRESILDLFNQDIGSFMTDLLKSFENVMSVADVKSEIVGEFIKADEWSKWWNKVKIALKKDPNIGMNPKKKDEIILHEKPITLSEELIMKFNAQSDYNKKLDIALDSLKDPDEAFEALESFNHFYNDEEQVKDPLRKILAYLFLEESSKTLGKEEVQRNLKPGDISQLIQNMKKEECLEFSKSLQNVEVKKGYVNLIKKYHPQAFDIMMGMLFEVPVKINKHVFQILNSEEKYSELNLFLETVLQKSKDHPEVFLWVAKSVLSDAWDHAWLKISKEDLLLRVFRILKPLGRIEEKGNRLKKIAQELILDEEAKILKETLSKVDTEFCRKLYALYREVPYIEDIKKDQFRDLLSSIRTDLIWEEEAEDTEEDDVYIPEDGILVTRQAFNHKKSEFDHLVNVEMLENSRDIGEAQEKGDLRENAEYKAAMEKQVQLQAQIKKIEAELKSARILDLSEVKTDRINIGCSVVLKNDQSNDKVTFSILGAWDANTEKNIISYQSPLAKSLLGKRVGESVSLVLDESASKYVIQSIARFSFVGQEA